MALRSPAQRKPLINALQFGPGPQRVNRRNLPAPRLWSRFQFEMGETQPTLSARYSLPDQDTASARAQREKEQAFQRRLAEVLGNDHLAAQKEAEAAREQKEREETSRRHTISRRCCGGRKSFPELTLRVHSVTAVESVFP